MAENVYGSTHTTTNLTTGPGTGPGGGYKEYRYYVKGKADQVLQVWTFNNSRAIHYRDDTSGSGAAGHEAWSFEDYDPTPGGTAAQKTTTAQMPAVASATYTGKFAATAQTSNWYEDRSGTGHILLHNNNWGVTGSSSVDVNFGTKAVTGTLRPETWGTLAADSSYDIVTVNGVPQINPDYQRWMDEKILLNGTIGFTATGNSVTGTAAMDTTNSGWLSSADASPFYGSLFGATGKEFTGIFNVDATSPQPIGGDPVNNPTRGYLQIGGAIHGTTP